uniref:Subtilisin-like protease SBT1.8 n=1 Tax=Tanacetum cinerariifolium TaxID=118510 RepID=A0A6L2MF07_TANCI|nr:subtilisin-like protease SBT1.8 [Tanacetum cinerariifolium]
MWLLAAQLEIKQSNLSGARAILRKAIECSPQRCYAWCKDAELERSLNETERARAIFELRIAQPALDMPELLRKEYIGFEIAEGEFERTRQLYGRLLVRTKHLKMCGSATHCFKHLPLKRYNNKETSFRSIGNFVSEGSEGMDVLSMSLGGGSRHYYRDIIAIGAFKDMEMGVFVLCSAGNSGPTKASLANVAPWIMTVGAETLDRDFLAYAVLGNGKKVNGVSLYSGKGMGEQMVEGVNPRVEKGQVVKEVGRVGMLLGNTAESGEELVADSHLLPAVAVGMKIGNVIREYLKMDKRPMAALTFGGTVLNVKPSPVVSAFSSRGPNMVTPQILKPDVIGPGVNIFAGWSGEFGPTGLETIQPKC